MKNQYVVWAAYLEPGKNFCVLDDLDNVDDDFELKKGVPRADGFPENAVMSMDAEYPKAIALADNIHNTCRLIVVSQRLKEFFDQRNLKNVEFLPVRIMNHKNRLASKDYFIINPIRPQECLDIKKSGCTWSDIIKDDIDEIKRLVLDEKRLDPEVAMFRLKHFYKPVLVKRELADAITAEGFTGLRWIELSDYES
jgi:hypothetical protein